MVNYISKYIHIVPYGVTSVFNLYNLILLMNNEYHIITSIIFGFAIVLSQVVCVYDVITNNISKFNWSWFIIALSSMLFAAICVYLSGTVLSVLVGLMTMIPVLLIPSMIHEQDVTTLPEEIVTEQEDQEQTIEKTHTDYKEKVHGMNRKKHKVVEGRFATEEELQNIEDIIIKRGSRIDETMLALNQLKENIVK